MDRLHELEVFIAAVDTGSFAKAAARLRLSPPAVTRAISSLEDRLGARVFNRTTRSLHLTETGTRFVESARRILSDLDTAQKEAVGETAAPQGHLTVTASVTFGRVALAPVVASFLKAHPRVSVSVLLLDRVANLVEEGIDAAVRIGPLPDSALIAKRVGEVRRVLVASPDYLSRRGVPTRAADLKLHAVIAFTGLMPSREWRFADGRGGNVVSLAPRLEINDAVAAIAAAEEGHGITIALSYMVADRIRAGRLATVLDELTPPAAPVHIVYPQSRLVAPKLRAFVDYAAPASREHWISSLSAASRRRRGACRREHAVHPRGAGAARRHPAGHGRCAARRARSPGSRGRPPPAGAGALVSRQRLRSLRLSRRRSDPSRPHAGRSLKRRMKRRSIQSLARQTQSPSAMRPLRVPTAWRSPVETM